MQRNLEIISAYIECSDQFFIERSQLFSWIEPKAGSVAFPQWLGDDTVEDFCQGVLDRQGVMLVPGSLFDLPGNHFRLGLGRKNFPQAIELVNGYLKRV